MTSRMNWPDVLNKSVHASDDADIGDVYALSRDFVVVKRGIIHKIHYYYIPISKVEGWDGKRPVAQDPGTGSKELRKRQEPGSAAILAKRSSDIQRGDVPRAGDNLSKRRKGRIHGHARAD